MRLAMWIEADDLTVEHAAATFQIASQPLAQSGEALEQVSIARDEPHAVVIGVQQRTESVPLDFEQPIWVREWRTGAAERQWLALLERHRGQYIEDVSE